MKQYILVNLLKAISFLIVLFSINCSGFSDSTTFQKYGVSVTFPENYKKTQDIGNESVNEVINAWGAGAETYSLETSYGIYGITFVRLSSKPKGTLEDGMKGAVYNVSGKLTHYEYIKVNGYDVLEFEYFTNKYGPTLEYIERIFMLDLKTLVSLKFTGIEGSTKRKEVKKFIYSLKIKQ